MFLNHSARRSVLGGKVPEFWLYGTVLFIFCILCTCSREASKPQRTDDGSAPGIEKYAPPGHAPKREDDRPIALEAERLQLLTPVREGDSETFRAMMARGAPLSSVDPAGRTALHWAAVKGRGDFVDALIKAGADLEATDADGRTPLHLAALADAGSVTRSLLNAGAVVDVRDNHGYLPVELALASGLESESRTLLEEAMARLQEEPGRSAVREVVRRYIEAIKTGDANTLQALSVPGTPKPPAEFAKPQALAYTLQQTDLFEKGAVVVGTLEFPDWPPVRFAMALKRCGRTWNVLGTSLWIE